MNRFAIAMFAGLACMVSGQTVAQVVPLVMPEPLDLVLPGQSVSGSSTGFAVRESATEIRIELAADVLFDFDKATIRPSAEPALKHAAEIIRANGNGPVLVEGYTDAKGNAAYNQNLSERRAAAVKAWLVEREGLKSVTFETRGYGAQRPVAPNARPDGSDDPDGRQRNRRVELVVRKG
jgi:outer membrane protein OmpA-like peptidoglycan-associated protein